MDVTPNWMRNYLGKDILNRTQGAEQRNRKPPRHPPPPPRLSPAPVKSRVQGK